MMQLSEGSNQWEKSMEVQHVQPTDKNETAPGKTGF